MEHPTKISDIDGVNNSAESPPAVMTGTQDTAGSSSATVSAVNKDNKSTKPLRPTASVFVPGALEVQGKYIERSGFSYLANLQAYPEAAAPGYVNNPYNIFQTTQQAGPGYFYNPYSFLQPTHRAVPGMMMSYAPQRPPFGEYGPGSVSSGRNQIEEAKYEAKRKVQYFKGSEPKARADVPAKKQKERDENGMTSKPRKGARHGRGRKRRRQQR
jgi:hypothetical protein